MSVYGRASLCAHVYVCSVREPCLCTRACEGVFFRVFPHVTVRVWVCAHICVPSACMDSFTSTCVSVYMSVCAHVFMDTGMTVDWENPLELVCASILVDENTTPVCNYNTTQIIFLLTRILAPSETHCTTTGPTTSKKPS